MTDSMILWFIIMEDILLIFSHYCPPSEENAYVAVTYVCTISWVCNVKDEGKYRMLVFSFQSFFWGEIRVHPETRKGLKRCES